MGRSLFFGAQSLVFYALLSACTPSSQLPTGSSSTSSGTGGEGGFFPVGGSTPGCTDTTDTDGDAIADSLEGTGDLDEDGTPNNEDTDSDGDGLLDADEATNPFLDPSQGGFSRDEPCDPLADTDGDTKPDALDKDSDNDGLSDKQEAKADPDGKLGCKVKTDCDGDGVIDLIEAAAGSDPADDKSVPDDPGLFFVLPYGEGEKTQDFVFSTGVSKADIYFMIDTTASMQPAIDTLKSSISTKVIPAILNGDSTANPPIPPIDDAWIGMGTFRDVPWSTYGQPGDDIYRHRFDIAGQTITGNVTPPKAVGNTFAAPDNVTKILNSLTAAGGGDAPEATTQALWIAATNGLYAATVGGIWSPASPYPAPCTDLSLIGVPCFRKDSIPIFVLMTDAAFHNGPLAVNNYAAAEVGGTKTYTESVDALNAISAKIVGVPVSGGNPNAARKDLTDLAEKTGSSYYDPQFGGTIRPLVSETDVTSGNVSDEVVRLLGLLSGAGLHDVTTDRVSYSCAGGVDCTGDGKPDLAYENPPVKAGEQPFDAAKLITKVAPVESTQVPKPYSSLDSATFFGVRGAAELTFRVHARNDDWAPSSLVVLRAKILVETPSGQLLGGAAGVKLVYFVIPEYLPVAE
ncbi:MAG: hypothetical protein IPK82_08545 [Polyangiaceae bacterium]|nr:hypothetical protein [Polyangiaceae bacterium]